MSISRIDRATCRNISDQAEAALKVLADELGLSLKRESSRFDPLGGTVTVKLTFGVQNASGASQADTQAASLLGLPADCIGRTFRSGRGTLYTITGINMRRRKYPVSATGPRGGRYKFTVAQVLSGLSKVAA
jgi:hypothetical protein